MDRPATAAAVIETADIFFDSIVVPQHVEGERIGGKPTVLRNGNPNLFELPRGRSIWTATGSSRIVTKRDANRSARTGSPEGRV